MSLLGWSAMMNGVLLGVSTFLVVRVSFIIWDYNRLRERETQDRLPPPPSSGCAFCDAGASAMHDGISQYHLSPDGKMRSPCRKYGVRLPKFKYGPRT